MGRHAEIAGGGIGGLTTALLLRQRGWSVCVHERAPVIREIGAGVALHNSATRVFEEMGVLEEIVASAVSFCRAEIRDEQGRVLMARDLGGASRTYNPVRQVVLRTLFDAAVAMDVEVRTSSPVRSATREGSLILEDDSTRSADLVVGADGFHSRVRTGLGLEGAKAVLRTGTTRTLIARSASEAEDVYVEYWSGSRRIGVCPTATDTTSLYMAALERDERGARLPIDVDSWRESFPGVPLDFFDRLESPKAEAVHHAYPYVRCHSWSAGRAAVVGDAAHALPPTLGQGVGLAVSNAWRLAEYVDGSADIPAALELWERDSRHITDRTQKWARIYDTLSSRWPRFLGPLRPWLIRHGTRIRRLEEQMSVADLSVARAPAATSRSD